MDASSSITPLSPSVPQPPAAAAAASVGVQQGHQFVVVTDNPTEIMKVAKQSFESYEVKAGPQPGTHIIVSKGMGSPETVSKADQMGRKTLTGEKPKEKEAIDRKTDEIMSQMMKGMKMGTDGTLAIEREGRLHPLGISAGELRAMVRASVKADTVGQQVFDIGKERFVQARDDQGQIRLIHQGQRIASGNSYVYRAFDMTIGDKGILKIEKDVEYTPGQKTASAEERDTYLFLNPSDSPCDGIIPAPHLCFQIGSGESATIGTFMQEEERGTLLKNLSELKPQERLNSLPRLARGVVRFNEKKVLHADMKPENVYVSRTGELRHADFDKVWNMRSPDELLAKMEEEDLVVPEASPNSKHPRDLDKLEEIGKKFRAKGRELKEKQENLAKAKSSGFMGIGRDKEKIATLQQEVEALQKEYEDLFHNYTVAAEGLHTWSFAFLAFQVLTGSELNIKEDTKSGVVTFTESLRSEDGEGLESKPIGTFREFFDKKVAEMKERGASDEEINLMNQIRPVIVNTLNIEQMDARMNLAQTTEVLSKAIERSASSASKRASRRFSVGTREGARLLKGGQ